MLENRGSQEEGGDMEWSDGRKGEMDEKQEEKERKFHRDHRLCKCGMLHNFFQFQHITKVSNNCKLIKRECSSFQAFQH
jgi:hypothetical protein